MGKKFSGRRPEDQPMYTNPVMLDFEKRRLFITSIGPFVKQLFDFLGLSDTPSSYSGQAGKVTKVNAGESALIFGKTEDDLGRHIIFDGGTTDDDLDSTSIMVLDLGGI